MRETSEPRLAPTGALSKSACVPEPHREEGGLAAMRRAHCPGHLGPDRRKQRDGQSKPLGHRCYSLATGVAQSFQVDGDTGKFPGFSLRCTVLWGGSPQYKGLDLLIVCRAAGPALPKLRAHSLC